MSDTAPRRDRGSKFDFDLVGGQAREDAFLHVISWGRFEHKRDFASSSTGNHPVEFERLTVNGSTEPSGISVTRAQWWCVEYEANCWLVLHVDRVKQLAVRAVKANRVRWGGDGKRARLALVPLTWFVEATGRGSRSDIAGRGR